MATPASSRLEYKLRRELNDTVLQILDDPRTEDLLLNPDGALWWKRMGSRYERAGRMDPDKAMAAISTVSSMRDTVVNHEHPILETELPGVEGHRFEAIVAPVTRGPVFAIRVRAHKVYSLEDYRAAGILGHAATRAAMAAWRPLETFDHLATLRSALYARQNILIVGSAAAGKTTLANAMLAELAANVPDDRLVLIEDAAELQCSSPNYVDLHSVDSGEHQVSMLDCLRATMRLRPTRIVIGEVRGREAYALLKSWNTGHPGGIATVHANDAISGLSRLESLVAEAPESRGTPQQQLIAAAVNVVVSIEQSDESPAGRVVREIALVRGWRAGNYEVEYV